ncbi:hypothetical protein OG989_03985 [Micromonospora sp. NBC_01740]|uniref:hypothetical protein n=1 Tax=Micromonospora sp. NBC_01740 TaxID=2975986 RepID=UPI002E157569|nr:hypothetical protein OG989_03985 [Micromonospora sp. NBC_01740]
MSHTVDHDIDLALDEPSTSPSRRHSRGDTSLSNLVLAYAVVLALAALFAGFLGAISGDLL